MRKMNSIKSRDVFYVAGYDPRGYRYYYSLFKKNSLLQNKINNLNLKVSKIDCKEKEFPFFNIDSNKSTTTKYTFLYWNDIVKNNWPENIFSILNDFLYFLRIYIFSGLCIKFARESRSQLIAGLYPLFYMIISYLLTFYLIYKVFNVTKNLSNIVLAILASFLVLFLATKLIKFLGKKLGVFWLSRIYAFCARWSNDNIKDIENRIDEFSEIIVKTLKENHKKEDYELILSSHSVGTILAVSVAARVIKKCEEENIDSSCFKLLTLGQCIPLVSFQKNSNKFKKDLEILSNKKDLIWFDFTSKIDGACFPMVDYLKTCGINSQKNQGPKFLSTRFFKLYEKEEYKKIRKNWYKAHFLYLMATQIKGQYDYFNFVAGPDKLENKIKQEK